MTPDSAVVADLNADGRPDVAAADLGSASVSVLINDGTWSAPQAPCISISDVTTNKGNGQKTTLFVFTVTLSTAYDVPVTMSYRTTDGMATTGDGD